MTLSANFPTFCRTMQGEGRSIPAADLSAGRTGAFTPEVISNTRSPLGVADEEPEARAYMQGVSSSWPEGEWDGP